MTKRISRVRSEEARVSVTLPNRFMLDDYLVGFSWLPLTFYGKASMLT